MSYCRTGPDSDVYVYQTSNYNKDRRKVVTQFICYECNLSSGTFESVSEMVNHLLDHRSVGHTVPDAAIERLLKCQSSLKKSTKKH